MIPESLANSSQLSIDQPKRRSKTDNSKTKGKNYNSQDHSGLHVDHLNVSLSRISCSQRLSVRSSSRPQSPRANPNSEITALVRRLLHPDSFCYIERLATAEEILQRASDKTRFKPYQSPSPSAKEAKRKPTKPVEIKETASSRAKHRESRKRVEEEKRSSSGKKQVKGSSGKRVEMSPLRSRKMDQNEKRIASPIKGPIKKQEEKLSSSKREEKKSLQNTKEENKRGSPTKKPKGPNNSSEKKPKGTTNNSRNKPQISKNSIDYRIFPLVKSFSKGEALKRPLNHPLSGRVPKEEETNEKEPAPTQNPRVGGVVPKKPLFIALPEMDSEPIKAVSDFLAFEDFKESQAPSESEQLEPTSNQEEVEKSTVTNHNISFDNLPESNIFPEESQPRLFSDNENEEAHQRFRMCVDMSDASSQTDFSVSYSRLPSPGSKHPV